MTPLAPAVSELRLAGVALCACGAGWLAALGPSGRDGLQGAGGGLAGSLLLLWVLFGARAAHDAARLALPVRPRWRLEAPAVTGLRVLLCRVLPVVGAAAAGAVVGGRWYAGAATAAAAAVVGAGLTGLLAAARLRRAELARGRRLLHRARLLHPLDRDSLFLEPAAFVERPEGPRRPAPWPAHRPPARPPLALVELEPVNGSPVRGAGVRARPAAPGGATATRRPGGPAGGG